MGQVPSDGCMKGLGIHGQLNGGSEKEFADVVQAARAAFHSKRPLKAAGGRCEDKAKALRLLTFDHSL